MSTLPKRKLVVSRACALFAVEVVVEARPCLREDIAVAGAVDDDGRRQPGNRPCLLSKITPFTVFPSMIVATTQQCKSVCTFDSRTMSLETSFSTSGSTVGDQ